MFQKPTKACELLRLSGETDVELAERRNRRYYEEQVEVSIKWWNRVGVSVDLAGKRVLDIGCGHGALAVEAAQRGAIMVLCIDIDLESVNFANSNVRNNPVPGVGVSFSTIGLIHIEAGSFDVCLSKDTFEHVIYMPSLLSQIHRILVRCITHLGDHGGTRLRQLPWLHAILPEWVIKVWLRSRYGHVIDNITDLGHNKLTASEVRSFSQKRLLASRFVTH